MTTKAGLLRLADEIEHADKGDRELDIKIALMAESYPRRAALWIGLELHALGRFSYTRSIDTALTLVPPLTSWKISTFDGPRSQVGKCEARARTISLALAAAALRARAETMEEAEMQPGLRRNVLEQQMEK